ncbi:MAG TPA: cyclopropane-fatty-acyl-phospholipid synthase family protein [Solirubrobacteraceae bacterium]|jgi:cyclopropane-fatty-acyl-phospholipid synthase|nr:cyclopropane-fatty-acyl-phospholipid synthase family protein [Solirubrobacteraceae bacterium]
MPLRTSEPLRRELAQALPERPFAVRFWDGTELAATADGGPVFTVRAPAAIAHLLRAPGQLGLGRAYAAGVLEADDLDRVIGLLDGFSAPPIDAATRARLMLAAVRACGLTRPPKIPASELRPRGRRHSRERDARAVRHHYDVSNEFFALFLDESMTYSCALFSRALDAPGETWGTLPRADRAERKLPTLEQAQEAKRELVCRKLGLREGQRILDVGCGWGSFVIHAATHHGVQSVGITLSPSQAELARRRVAAAGLQDRVEIRVADYRDLGATEAGRHSPSASIPVSASERYDAIASIGMVEHVGANQIDLYARQLAGLLEPGGLLLNHGIARLRHSDAEAGPFSERYVFPDAAPLHVSRIALALERAGIEPLHAEGMRQDYIDTLSEWIERLDANRAEAERLAGGERVRVWRLYLRAARNGFATGFTSIFQVLGRRA